MRPLIASLFVVAFLHSANAQEKEIRQGKIHKVDAKNSTITIGVADAAAKDKLKLIELIAVEDTRFKGADGQFVNDGLKDPQFKEGTLVMFKAVMKDGKNYLIGMRIPGMKAGGDEPKKVDTTGLKPLTELGKDQVAQELLRFFKTDTTTRIWFVR